MSANDDGKDQNAGFAKAWAAAKASVGNAGEHGRGLRLVETVVKQEDREEGELFGGFSPDPTLAGTGETSEDTKAEPALAAGGDNLTEKSSPESNDNAPKSYDASKLKSASKRQNRPFAPPERVTKTKRASRHGVLLNTRGGDQYTRSELANLQYLTTLVQQCQQETIKGGSDLPRLFEQLRTHLQDAIFYGNVTEVLVRDSKVLKNGGLPSIFDKLNCNFPHDLCSDALTLYMKWFNGDFDPDLFRGIEHKSNITPGNGSRKSRNLKPGYHFKTSAGYIGKGSLTNGQWWPLQICLLRDGAHGAIEGGIWGKQDGVAYSVIVTSNEYSDIDNGDQIEYCGTSGQNKMPTSQTKMLIKSAKCRTPVRVFRSASAKSGIYLRKKGLRYDGLYDVTGYEVLHVDTAMYRFTLMRQQGQEPIRYAGVGARPNEKELATYRRLRQDLGLSA